MSKSGMDGSGSHRARHQKVDISKSLEENPHLDPELYKNYLLTTLCPLKLSSTNQAGVKTLVWENKSPNSLTMARPLSLIRAAESREVIESEFNDLFAGITDKKSQVCLDSFWYMFNMKFW